MFNKWKTMAGVSLVALTVAGLAVVPAMADRGEKVADALGITEDELQAAQEQAHAAAIQQALDEGLITQDQADFMLEREARGFGPMRGGIGMHMRGGTGFGSIDHQELLASELGISVEDLQAALDQAHADRLAEAIANGDITQEQADAMQARHQLRDYLNQDDVQGTLRAAYETVVAQAVESGVITQEQADSILSNEGLGFGGLRGFGSMRGGCDMRGSFGSGDGQMGTEYGHRGMRSFNS